MGNQSSKKTGEVKKMNPTELQTYIMVVQTKLTQHRNKKVELIKKKRKEVASKLEENELDIAKAKMDSILREEDLITVYDILGPLCEILKEKVSYLLLAEKCPDDIRATLDTIIYSSTRLEIEELHKIREIIKSKYGEIYVAKANSNADSLVNVNVVEKLKVKQASDQYLIARLKQLCREENIVFNFPQDIIPMMSSFEEPFNNFNNNYSQGGGNINYPQMNFNNSNNFGQGNLNYGNNFPSNQGNFPSSQGNFPINQSNLVTNQGNFPSNQFQNNQSNLQVNPSNFQNIPSNFPNNQQNFPSNNLKNYNQGGGYNYSDPGFQYKDPNFSNNMSNLNNQNISISSNVNNRYNDGSTSNLSNMSNNFENTNNQINSSMSNHARTNSDLNFPQVNKQQTNFSNSNHQEFQGGMGNFPTHSLVMNKNNINDCFPSTGNNMSTPKYEIGASYNTGSPTIKKKEINQNTDISPITPKPQDSQLPRNDQSLSQSGDFKLNNNSINPYQDDFNSSNQNRDKRSSVPNKLFSNEQNATPKPIDEDINQNYTSSQQFNGSNFYKTDVVFMKDQFGNSNNNNFENTFPQPANRSAFYNQVSSVDDLFPMPKSSNFDDFPQTKK